MSDVMHPRNLPDRLDQPLWKALKSWEMLLLVVGSGIFLAGCLSSPYFLDPWNLSDASYNFTEKGIVALAMAFLIVAGEIDLSVAATMALASTAMGAAVQAGAGTPVLVAISLGVGLLCGMVNGLLVTRFRLPAIVVTIGTMSLYRGIASIVLGDQAYKGYPADFAWFGQGSAWWVVTVELVIFTALALVAGFVLHMTVFGRQVKVIGNNPLAALFSGVRVARVKFLLFCLTGLAAGLAAVLLTSRLGSTRYDIATGWELEVVTIVVLGGVSINGGSGTILGVVLASIILGLVTFALGLLNVKGIEMSIIIGAMLIAVIALPILIRRMAGGGRGR